MKRLLVTGSRHGWDEDVLTSALDEALTFLGSPRQHVTLVHGRAAGVDTQAATYFRKLRRAGRKVSVEGHKADWPKYHNGAGPRRNQKMVDRGADLCVAFLDKNSKGTKDCMDKAHAAGIDVWYYKR